MRQYQCSRPFKDQKMPENSGEIWELLWRGESIEVEIDDVDRDCCRNTVHIGALFPGDDESTELFHGEEEEWVRRIE